MVLAFLVGVFVGILGAWLYGRALETELADDLGMME